MAKGDLIYLEVRALKYLQSWPNVPHHDAMQVIRLHSAGLIQSYTDGREKIVHDSGAKMDDWSGHSSSMTSIGEAMVFYFQGMGGFSYASVAMILDLWPLSQLKAKTPQATAFIELFRQSWNDPDIKEYVAARKEEIRYRGLSPDMEHPFSGRLVSANPNLVNLTPFLPPEESEPDFFTPTIEIIEGPALDAKMMDNLSRKEEIQAALKSALTISPFETIKCEYCEGTRMDPFEDGQPCAVCLERDNMPARYFYHPESSSLFVSHDPNYTPGDGLVEEIDEAKAMEIKARLEAEEAGLNLKPVTLAAPVEEEPDFGLPEEDDWDIA